MKYLIVCDYREKFPNPKANDHYSFNSILNIKNTINELGFQCEYFGGVNELIKAISTQKYDKEATYLNFNDGLHGEFKRGQTPFLLDMMNVVYSGSNPLTHLIISNKLFTNKFLDNKIKNLFIPKTISIKSTKEIENITLNFPVIVKPNNEGSSIGITNDSICNNLDEVKKIYDSIKRLGEIIVQEFINGYELTNFFMVDKKSNFVFNELLLISKDDDLNMNNKVFTSNDKFEHKRKYNDPHIILSDNIINEIKKITTAIAKELNIKTFGRIDYKLYNQKLHFIEANTNPAFSITSDIGEICKIYNKTFKEMIHLFLNSIN